VQNGGPESPDAPAPAIVQARFAQPVARAVHSSAAGAAKCLRVTKEPQRNSGETIKRRSGAGFSGGDDQHARDVVRAIADVG
jgi:hypothetical protein